MTAKKITDIVTIKVKFPGEPPTKVCPPKLNSGALLRELEKVGDIKLAQEIRQVISTYRCSICGKNDKVGFTFDVDDNTHIVLFCISCSGDAVKEGWE